VDIEALALAPLALLYAIGWEAYRAVYTLGLKRPKAPHRPVVCVGNLTVGGTGKTPLTIYLARLMLKTGREVVIGASGYGSPSVRAARLAPEGELDAGLWGDEPAMIRWRLPGVPLIVGRRRVLAAELCARHFPRAVLLMDDGFQHLPLRKHLSLIVHPRYDLNRLCLPAGPYREPRARGRARADLELPGDRFGLERSETYLTTPDRTPASAEGLEANLLCAVADPWPLQRSLEAQGARIVAARFLADHDRLDAGNLFREFDPKLPLIATAKDWVKLRRRADLAGREVLVANYDVRVTPEEAFARWLDERLNEFDSQEVGAKAR
jgi:tetraacyldisaccharide 4'-kinase